MAKGTVKFFNHSKGFGFIKVDDTGEEVFFHVSKIKEDLFENSKVEFDIEKSTRGLNAVNIKLA
jgi:CspA family cold shock protein